VAELDNCFKRGSLWSFSDPDKVTSDRLRAENFLWNYISADTSLKTKQLGVFFYSYVPDNMAHCHCGPKRAELSTGSHGVREKIVITFPISKYIGFIIFR